MPLYSYYCKPCNASRVDVRKIDDRHNGPKCDRCRKKMVLQISSVSGVVKNPAVPRGR